MPKQIQDARQFLELARAQTSSTVKIITVGDKTTKFKLRTPKYLYTLVVGDKNKAAKVASGINSSVKKIYIKKNELKK